MGLAGHRIRFILLFTSIKAVMTPVRGMRAVAIPVGLPAITVTIQVGFRIAMWFGVIRKKVKAFAHTHHRFSYTVPVPFSIFIYNVGKKKVWHVFDYVI